MISSSIQFLVVFTSVFQHADATCTRSGEKPLISVTNSTHLNVAWANAFSRNCLNRRIHINKTEMIIQKNSINRTVTIQWSSKDFALETDPCMRHVIETKVTFTDILTGEEEEEFSSPAYYNYDQEVENLYSGLLKEQVLDKLCEKANGKYLIPSVPSEVQHCITKRLKIEIGSRKWKFEIQNPLGQGRTPITGQVERLDKCNSTLSQAFQPTQSELDFPILALIIGSSILASLFLIPIFAVVFRKSCKTKKKMGRAEADVNPVYDGAADYEYDEMVTYDDSNKVIMTTVRREVKAEVVDRSSIYGEEEEGWENAVVVDNNPDYGE